MPTQRASSLVWIGAALMAALALSACTAGGNFDPTELLSSDMFNTKKKLVGDREPLFPNGVPGAETGVPPDLVKGYQAPPEQAADASAQAQAPAPKPAAEVKPKPKPKPKPVVAHAPPPAAAPPQQDPAWNRAPTPVGGQQPWPAPQNAAPQANWPAAPPAGQAGQSAWPPAPQAQGH